MVQIKPKRQKELSCILREIFSVLKQNQGIWFSQCYSYEKNSSRNGKP